MMSGAILLLFVIGSLAWLNTVTEPRIIFGPRPHRIPRSLFGPTCPTYPEINVSKIAVKCGRRLDVFFVLDGSASIELCNFKIVQHFLARELAELNISQAGIHVGLLQFGRFGQLRVEFAMNQVNTRQSAVAAMTRFGYLNGYGTALGSALLKTARIFNGQNGDRPDIPNVVVVLTDGKPEGDPVNAIAAAGRLKRKVERIVGVGFGRNLPSFIDNLRKIASPGEVIEIPEIHKLDEMIDPLRHLICGTKIARCSATGHHHYKTFDGKRFNFMGKCKYVLAKHTRRFKVLQKNEPCGHQNVTCIKAIIVIVKGLNIRIVRGGVTTVNKVPAILPYFNKGIKIVRRGRRVKVTTNIGLTVRYNGVYNVFVDVLTKYWGKVLGLCGNFNGDRKDDFTKSDNQVTGDPVSFGNSWKVGNSCPDALNITDPCKSAGQSAQIAKRECYSLRKEPFTRCNKILNPNKGYIPNCQYDVCGCEGSPVACLCEAYAAYSEDCRAAGVLINWRSFEIFRQCDSTCASAPCFNGGTCKNGMRPNTYNCTCPQGFKGSRCEEEDTAKCTASGDPHYRTFDNKPFNFMGKCKYILTKHNGTFEVLQKNEPCGNGKVTCTKAIMVIVKELKIHVVRGGVITVDGVSETLPYNNKGINIIRSGPQVKITTDVGMTVVYDVVHNVVIVELSTQYRGEVFGFCGNFNGKKNDDFTTSDNQVTGNVTSFGNSWEVENSCPI